MVMENGCLDVALAIAGVADRTECNEACIRLAQHHLAVALTGTPAHQSGDHHRRDITTDAGQEPFAGAPRQMELARPRQAG